MTYYHVRYMVHTHADGAFEKEEWITTDERISGEQLRQKLVAKYHCNISVLQCLQISREVYLTPHNSTPPVVLATSEVDANNLWLWNLDERSRVNKKLQVDASETADRFRNIDEPEPLL